MLYKFWNRERYTSYMLRMLPKKSKIQLVMCKIPSFHGWVLHCEECNYQEEKMSHLHAMKYKRVAEIKSNEYDVFPRKDTIINQKEKNKIYDSFEKESKSLTPTIGFYSLLLTHCPSNSAFYPLSAAWKRKRVGADSPLTSTNKLTKADWKWRRARSDDASLSSIRKQYAMDS